MLWFYPHSPPLSLITVNSKCFSHWNHALNFTPPSLQFLPLIRAKQHFLSASQNSTGAHLLSKASNPGLPYQGHIYNFWSAFRLHTHSTNPLPIQHISRQDQLQYFPTPHNHCIQKQMVIRCSRITITTTLFPNQSAIWHGNTFPLQPPRGKQPPYKKTEIGVQFSIQKCKT